MTQPAQNTNSCTNQQLRKTLHFTNFRLRKTLHLPDFRLLGTLCLPPSLRLPGHLRFQHLILLSILSLLPQFLSPLFAQSTPSGNLIIFHAGSLSVPLHQIAREFQKSYPDVKPLLESAGSVASARKITDLHKPCDILASADYQVIDNLLIPKYTDQNIPFATNEMVIAYTPQSRQASLINSTNWYSLLLHPDIRFGRSDPDSDPCGYRTVMTLQLAALYYNIPDLTSQFLKKDTRFIRPKEVDLLALLESENIDYVFIYKSVAIQHHLRYLTLPDEINLGSDRFATYYQQASVRIRGKTPGDTITLTGEPMIYSITILRDAPNKPAAEAFLRFLLNPAQGGEILRENGQGEVGNNR